MPLRPCTEGKREISSEAEGDDRHARDGGRKTTVAQVS